MLSNDCYGFIVTHNLHSQKTHCLRSHFNLKNPEDPFLLHENDFED